MNSRMLGYALGLALTVGALGVSCSQSEFGSAGKFGETKKNKSAAKGGADLNGRGDGKGDSDASDGDAEGKDKLLVPTGEKRSLPGGGPVKVCKVADESIATCDESTGKIKGKKPGTTTVEVTGDDGKQTLVEVTVKDKGDMTAEERKETDGDDGGSGSEGDTAKGKSGGKGSGGEELGQETASAGGKGGGDDIGTDSGSFSGFPEGDGAVTEDGEITKIKGNVALGGPACNISFLVKSPAEARKCMQAANSRPCSNDPECGAFQLRICDVVCEKEGGLDFDDPETCRRFNPLKGNPRSPVEGCSKR